MELEIDLKSTKGVFQNTGLTTSLELYMRVGGAISLVYLVVDDHC